jgi:hypothetical protein
VQTKWSHVPLTFDNGSQVDIIFLHAFDRMGISHSLLKPSNNPLYGFGGKGTFPVGKIELPLSFGVAPNARSEQVTFDIVDMVYLYNAIMGRGSINKFEAAIHGLYLCMKIPGPQGVIRVYGNQQAARNIERDFVLGQRNIHCLTAQREVPKSASPTAKEHEKAQLQSNDGTKTVPLDQATPKQTVIISEDLTSHDEQIGRPQQIHLQVRRAKPTFPQNTPRCKRLRMGTRASGSLRFTEAAPVKVGDSYKPQPLATPVALHRSFAARGQCRTGSRAGQRGLDQEMSSLLRLQSTHNIKMQHDRTRKSRLRSCYGFAQIAPLF